MLDTILQVGAVVTITGTAVLSGFAVWRTNTIKILENERDAYQKRSERLEKRNEELIKESEYYQREIGKLNIRLGEIEKNYNFLKEVVQGKDPAFKQVITALTASLEKFSITFQKHAQEDEENFARINSHMSHMTSVLEKIDKHLAKLK